MPDPEISKRCPECGASTRELAFFCPQCGTSLPRQRAGQAPSGVALQETPPRDTESPGPQSPRSSMSDTVLIERPEQAPPATPGARMRESMGARLQRATTLARDVEGDVIHRVQKVREISSVVLDEAGDDPALRFVLVAAIVFILFLVFVILNNLIS